MKRVLIAGIGNIFMGDDAFGCEVAQQLRRCQLPAEVDVVDFGIRGMDLGYALTEGYDTAILIDTAERGGTPGTVYLIEPEIPPAAAPADSGEAPLIAPHDMDPAKVLRLVASLGERRPRRILLLGCEPEHLGGSQGHMGLSDAVSAAVARAVSEVQALLGGWPPPTGALGRRGAST